MPHIPISPNVKKIITIAGLLGLLLGVGLTFLLEMANNTFRTPDLVAEK